MVIPTWTTESGSLGTIQENIYFEYQLSATGSNVKFKLQAGHLPLGITITEDGLLKGTPYLVYQTITNTFVIRAYDETDPDASIYDRTFSISVEGADQPFFITTDYILVTEYSGNKISYQIEYSDPDISQSLTIRKTIGELPPGLSLDTTGKISGIVPLLPGYTGQLSQPYDVGGYDTRNYDLDPIDPGYNYQEFTFTLEISDGIYKVQRSYAIRIKEPPLNLPPTIIQEPGNIGTFRHDNYFEYKFLAYDVFFQGVTWSLVSGVVPFDIDPESGVLSGRIPELLVGEETYTFSIRATRPGGAYTENEYTITFIGDNDKDLTWITNADLGTLNVGDQSYFHIETYNSSNLTIAYKYASGNLPEGLSVLASGDIAGRVKFGSFTLDNASTTLDGSNTLIDQTHKFMVRAYSINDYVSSPPIYLINETKEYSIRITDPYHTEYTNIYIEALVKQSQRDKWYNILSDTTIFPTNSLYYPDDSNYALPRKPKFLLLAGIKLLFAYEFLELMAHNFYKKSVILGEPRATTAYDPKTKQPIYEVIYLPIYDDLENKSGNSVSSSLSINGLLTAYPNSYKNMQNNIGSISNQVTSTTFEAFPLWMKSLYPNLSNNSNPREVYKRAIPIAYLKVGESNRILFNLKQKKIDFKQFSFETLRLTIDDNKPTILDNNETTLNLHIDTYFDNHTVRLPDSYVLDPESPIGSSFTTFDNQGTRFSHEEVTLDKGDPPYKYMRFPDTTLFE